MKVRELLERLEGVDPDTDVEVTVHRVPFDGLPRLIGAQYAASSPGNRSYFEIEVEVSGL